jgi:hypothetical protein
MILTVTIQRDGYEERKSYSNATYQVDNGDLSIHRGEEMIAYFPKGIWAYVEGELDDVQGDQNPQS